MNRDFKGNGGTLRLYGEESGAAFSVLKESGKTLGGLTLPRDEVRALRDALTEVLGDGSERKNEEELEILAKIDIPVSPAVGRALASEVLALRSMLRRIVNEVIVSGTCPICKPSNKFGHTRDCAAHAMAFPKK